MKITLLGTGTPAPSITRQSSGYAVETGNDLLVFDHGPGAHQRLLEAGYRATDVTHFFFTHYHYDHLMDYPRLLLTRWDHGAPDLPQLKVFGPAPLAEINNRVMGPDGLFALDIADWIARGANFFGSTFASSMERFNNDIWSESSKIEKLRSSPILPPSRRSTMAQKA